MMSGRKLYSKRNSFIKCNNFFFFKQPFFFFFFFFFVSIRSFFYFSKSSCSSIFCTYSKEFAKDDADSILGGIKKFFGQPKHQSPSPSFLNEPTLLSSVMHSPVGPPSAQSSPPSKPLVSSNGISQASGQILSASSSSNVLSSTVLSTPLKSEQPRLVSSMLSTDSLPFSASQGNYQTSGQSVPTSNVQSSATAVTQPESEQPVLVPNTTGSVPVASAIKKVDFEPTQSTSLNELLDDML